MTSRGHHAIDGEIRVDRMIEDFEALRRHGLTSSGGSSRPAYSTAFMEACDWLEDRMRDAGLAVRRDEVGNVIGRTGPDGAAVLTGSHLDTVVDGGHFDGTLGVLAGIECARWFADHPDLLRRPLEVVAFADEEGRFTSCLGSLALTGALSRDQLSSLRDGRGAPIARVLSDVGLGPLPLATHAPTLHAYVELHIDQEPLAADYEVGVVEAIAGLHTMELTFTGRADHAGAAPVAIRRDALLAAATLIVEATAEVRRTGSEDARITFSLAPGGTDTSVVTASAHVRCDVRELSEARLSRLVDTVQACAAKAAREQSVDLVPRDLGGLPPASMSAHVQQRIVQAAEEQGLRCRPVVSRAAHDASALARVAPTGMVFVANIGGRSHVPDEHARWEDIAAGASVLLGTLRNLVGEETAE